MYSKASSLSCWRLCSPHLEKKTLSNNFLNRKFVPEPPAHVVPEAFYLCVENATLIHQDVDVGICLLLEPPQHGQCRMMTVKVTTVPIPLGSEQCRYSLLINDQIGHHSLNAGYPFLQLIILHFQLIPLTRSNISFTSKVKLSQDLPCCVPHPPWSTSVPPIWQNTSSP